MNLTWTPELRRFREEVAAFAAASLPPDIRDKVLRHQRLERDDYVRWHLVLADCGWGAPTWPVEHGGTGWNALQRLIFEVECFKAGAPRLLPFGLSMIGPVLMKYGSAAQQAELLPRIIRVQDWWCQGYSEPGSVRTWPRCRPAPSATAASTWSTARRPGPRWRNTPTACSAWSAPITARAPSAAFPCCCWTCERPASACVRSGRWTVAATSTKSGWKTCACRPSTWWGREPGLDLRQVPARPRAYRHRRARALPPRAGHPQAHGVAGDFTGPSAAGRQPHARPHFAHRGRHHGAGDAAAARGRRRRRRAGRRGVGAEDTRLRNPAGPGHAADGGPGLDWPYDRTGCWRARTGTGRGRRWRLPPARATPTCARPRSTAAPRKCRRASSRARAGAVTSGCWSPDARQRQPVDGSPAPSSHKENHAWISSIPKNSACWPTACGAWWRRTGRRRGAASARRLVRSTPEPGMRWPAWACWA